jgi:dephospho-CoA kinase
MLRVALTGNIASGKSTAASIWSDVGVPVVRADDLAREVVVPGSDGLQAIVREFGIEMLDEDGSLNRDRLRDRVFRSADDRARLEGILHPLIGDRRDRWMELREAEGAAVVVAEIPLLFEADLAGDFDAVVLVVAPREERIRRLVEERGIAEDEAERMVSAQMPQAEKVQRTDYLLENRGSLEDLTIRALALLDLLRAKARGGSPK